MAEALSQSGRALGQSGATLAAQKSTPHNLTPTVPLVPPQVDPVLYALVFSLTGFGLVMVYSASAVYARQHFGSQYYFLNRCALWDVLGLTAMAIGARVDYRLFRRLAYPILILGILLLVGVLIGGVRINGARRWFRLAGVSFQPAELTKLALVMYLSCSLSKKAEKVRLFAVGFLPHLLVAGVIMLLLLKQPDLGTAVIAGGVTLTLLFIAGAKISYLLMALLAAAPVIYQSIVSTRWRMMRVLAFLDPWQYRSTVGYQVAESLISIGSGGTFGLGLGDGRQKLFFLPEAHTDYIMAIVGEELGFVGICAVVLCFLLIVTRGILVAMRARDTFGTYLAAGITVMLGLQAAINAGVVLGSLPTKGLPMPFVSFGGSSLVVDLFAIGILLNISRAAPEPAQLLPTRFGLARLFSRGLWQSAGNRRRRGKGRRAIIETGSGPFFGRKGPADTLPGDSAAELFATSGASAGPTAQSGAVAPGASSGERTTPAEPGGLSRS